MGILGNFQWSHHRVAIIFSEAQFYYYYELTRLPPTLIFQGEQWIECTWEHCIDYKGVHPHNELFQIIFIAVIQKALWKKSSSYSCSHFFKLWHISRMPPLGQGCGRNNVSEYRVMCIELLCVKSLVLLVRSYLLYVSMCVHLWNKGHLYKLPKWWHRKMLTKMLSCDQTPKLSMISPVSQPSKQGTQGSRKDEEEAAETDAGWKAC